MNLAFESKKMWLEQEHTELSIRQQCGLLGINRSSLYYHPVGIDAYTLLMHELDKQYTETPFYGVLKMTEHLKLRNNGGIK